MSVWSAPEDADAGALATQPAAPDHLVISELTTGGASASDEFVELYNATDGELRLAELELIYVSASGSTVTRRVRWDADSAASVAPRAHFLAAHADGIFSGIADATYTGGMSATGGSVALRASGSTTAIDAVGWGSATNSWMEGTPAPAPAAGSSIERLPGGTGGSAQDTDNNAVDFVENPEPDPQNSASAPISPELPTTADPSPTPPVASPSPSASEAPSQMPSPSESASPTPVPTPVEPTATPPDSTEAPTPSPAPTAIPISAARGLADGDRVTIAGIALTPSDFTDGGGYLNDDTGGIAVLVSGGEFAAGERLQLTGELDSRYHQRTIRVEAPELSRLGYGSDPAPVDSATGSVGESHESRLVHVSGQIQGPADELTSAVAFQLDDGSGATRVVVGNATGIDTRGWVDGATVELIGVVGQRDSAAAGSAGYRVQPRSQADVVRVTPPTVASPSPSASPSPRPSPSPTPGASVTPRPSGTPAPTGAPALVTISAARASQPGAQLRIRGVVTADAGRLGDRSSAVVQDTTGGLLLRLADGASVGARGTLVEVSGVRSSKSGMASLRVRGVSLLGRQGEPIAARVATGAIGEDDEARLVVARGAVSSAPRRSSTGTVSFSVDDGSGPLRVVAFRASAGRTAHLERGSWIEIRGVVGQQTTAANPSEGYRLWPRDAADVRTIAPAIAEQSRTGSSRGTGADRDQRPSFSQRDGTRAGPAQDLAGLLQPGGTDQAVRATLVAGHWPELGVAGIVWDGRRAVAVDDTPQGVTAVVELLREARVPLVIEMPGAAARHSRVGALAAWVLEVDAGDRLRRVSAPPLPPATGVQETAEATWVRLVGSLSADGAKLALDVDDAQVAVDYACGDRSLVEPLTATPETLVVAEGLFGRTAEGPTMLVPCGALRSAPVLGGGALALPSGDVQPEPRGDVAAADTPTAVDRRAALAVGAADAAALLGVVGTLAYRRGTIARLLEALRTDSSDGES